MTNATAILAADVVLFAYDDGRLHVLLIRRGWDPYVGCWALPGGHVDEGERFEDAARRELVEETGVFAPAALVKVGAYGDPGRDPRGRVVTEAWAGCLPHPVAVVAGDDAVSAAWMPVDLLVPEVLAFDHWRIVQDTLVVAGAALFGDDR